MKSVTTNESVVCILEKELVSLNSHPCVRLPTTSRSTHANGACDIQVESSTNFM